MGVKEILLQHRVINSAIDAKLEQIADLRRLATKITRDCSTVVGSCGRFSDRVGNTAVKIADLEEEINRDIDRLVDLKERIKGICGLLADETQKTIIERRYILGEEWEDIADKIGYSSRHIARLHARAIEQLEILIGSSELIA